ncbi:MAG: recombinase family protein [Patescibacteria group bacterium]
MDNQKETCVIFARVSTPEQEQTGYSLPSQLKLLTDYAEKKNFTIINQYIIAESARKSEERKKFKEMMSFISKQGIKNIIFEKVDRISRSMKDSVELNEWLSKDETRKIHSVKDNLILHHNSISQEKLNWNIKAVLAQNYIDNLSEEVKKGQKEKIAQGWLPSKPPYGYKTIGEKGHKIHVIDDNIAPLIKKMFELYATGTISLERLADKMYDLGLRKRSGLKMKLGAVHALLKDPFFFGLIKWNKKLYPGKQEPLIAKELYDKVQEVRTRKEAPTYQTHADMLFRKIFTCKNCGGLISWEKQIKRKGKHIYGHCNHYQKCAKRTYVKEPEINQQISSLFSKLEVKSQRLADWIKKSLKENHQEEIEYRTNTKTELNNRLNALEQRLSKVYDDKLDGKFSSDFCDKKFEQYKQEQEATIESLKKLSNETLRYYEVGFNIYDLSQNAQALYEQADVDKKRRLIKLVFDELLLDESQVIHKYAKPFEILSKAVAKTNRSEMAKNEKIEFKISEHSDFRLDIKKNRALNPVPLIQLPHWQAFMSLKWFNEVKYPEYLQNEVNYFINLPEMQRLIAKRRI